MPGIYAAYKSNRVTSQEKKPPRAKMPLWNPEFRTTGWEIILETVTRFILFFTTTTTPTATQSLAALATDREWDVP